MNQELINYVKSMQAKGISNQEIINNLKQVGWPEAIILQLFNNQIPTPSFQEKPLNFEDEPLKQLDKKAILLFFLANNISIVIMILFFISLLTTIPMIILGEGNFGFIALIIISVIFILFLIIYFIATLQYKFYRYTLKEQGFYKEYGIIAKRFVTIPYEKIQNIDIYQTLTARILKIYAIQVQTAGMSGVIGAEGILPGLSKEEAERLKNEMLTRSRLINKRNY